MLMTFSGVWKDPIKMDISVLVNSNDIFKSQNNQIDEINEIRIFELGRLSAESPESGLL